jgi:putative tricarboxylic transport membrane protein
MFDVAVAVIFGFLVVLLRVRGYPVVPLFLGLILGPLAEASFVRSLALSRLDVSVFWASTPSKVLLAAFIILLLGAVFGGADGLKRRLRSSAAKRVGNGKGSPRG